METSVGFRRLQRNLVSNCSKIAFFIFYAYAKGNCGKILFSCRKFLSVLCFYKETLTFVVTSACFYLLNPRLYVMRERWKNWFCLSWWKPLSVFEDYKETWLRTVQKLHSLFFTHAQWEKCKNLILLHEICVGFVFLQRNINICSNFSMFLFAESPSLRNAEAVKK